MRVRLAILLAFGAALVAMPTASGRTSLTIRVHSATLSVVQFERPPKGNVGDMLFYRSRLINPKRQLGKKKGVIVGSDEYQFILLSKTRWKATGSTTLPGGKIYWTGKGKVTKNKYLGGYRITGGTKRYKGAKGTIVDKPVKGTKRYRLNIYKISLP